jgi:FkbM family methyltransferase
MKILRRLKSLLTPNPDRFLKKASGVIHVGANTGGERDLYKKHGLRVVWVEPIPEVFQTLKANLAGYPAQRAFQALVTDLDNSEYPFHVSNRGGASSSILDLKLHRDIWPDVNYERTLVLTSTTLASLLEREKINAGDYDVLVMDTQGSELLVLRGADGILNQFKFIKTEVADFEAYAGCCQLRDIDRFLGERGFRQRSVHTFAERSEGGRYYDVVYERKSAAFD